MKKNIAMLLIIGTLFGCTLMASAAEPKVGYLWSEHNASLYNWLFQDKALEILDTSGIKYDKLSDKEASDVKTLSKYDVITGVSIYSIPNWVVSSLMQYVKNGGKVVLSEAPVASPRKDICEIFGFEKSDSGYYSFKNVTFKSTDKSKLKFKETLAATGSSNYYISEGSLMDTAEVWITAQGLMAPSKGVHEEKNLDALIVNRYGKGLGILLNWNLVTAEDPMLQTVYVESILWAAEQ